MPNAKLILCPDANLLRSKQRRIYRFRNLEFDNFQPPIEPNAAALDVNDLDVNLCGRFHASKVLVFSSLIQMCQGVECQAEIPCHEVRQPGAGREDAGVLLQDSRDGVANVLQRILSFLQEP